MNKPDILIVDDDRIILDSLCEFLRLEGYATNPAASADEAIRAMMRQPYGLVITDVNMPDRDGISLLTQIKSRFPQTVVIVLTGYGTIESAVEAIKLGAFDYLTKPVVDDDLRAAVERAIRQQTLIRENQSLRSQQEQKIRLENIVARDSRMARIFEMIDSVADSTTTILMTGRSGTGKSLLARAIHQRSHRRDKPFVEVSCGALPETLLESELFGHVRGSFTGAIRDKQGKFLAADGGTIFLDEITTASPAMQVKLLRVLQERQFEPVGSNKTITVDTRVILASNTDLAEEVRAGRFREDLYYRVHVVAVAIPRLAERPTDIPLLAEHFLRGFCRSHGRTKEGISAEAMERLARYDWPGNVRELENVIERAVLLGKGLRIEAQDLPEAVAETRPDTGPAGGYRGIGLKQALAEPEKAILRAALESHGWNRQDTAAALGINRITLYKKMKRYGLDEEAKRANA
jgi:DNA-binding NtrC family response regulator